MTLLDCICHFASINVLQLFLSHFCFICFSSNVMRLIACQGLDEWLGWSLWDHLMGMWPQRRVHWVHIGWAFSIVDVELIPWLAYYRVTFKKNQKDLFAVILHKIFCEKGIESPSRQWYWVLGHQMLSKQLLVGWWRAQMLTALKGCRFDFDQQMFWREKREQQS